MNLSKAKDYAHKIRAWLEPHCERIEIAGSIRRQRPEPNDVDFVCIPRLIQEHDLLGEVTSSTNLVQKNLLFHRAAGKCRIDAGNQQGAKLMTVQLSKCQLDVYFATVDTFATILLCRTGSKEHNILIAQRAEGMGGKWEPNKGLTLPNAGPALPAPTEEDIYRALKLPFIEPRYRESEYVTKLIRHNPITHFVPSVP